MKLIKNISKWVIMPIVVVILACNCSNQSGKNSTALHIHHYETAFMEIDTNNIASELLRLSDEYAIFLDGADFEDPQLIQQVKDFITDEQAIELWQDVKRRYPDFKPLEKELGKGLNRYRWAFHGDHNIPEVYTYLSYLDYENRVLYEDDYLLIAIDMYLGQNYPHYTSIQIPQYIAYRLDAPFIATDAMRAIAHYELGNQPLRSMLDHMILQGKVIYFLEEMLPNTKEHILFGFTKDQMKWCHKHEKMLWSYFIEENLIYEEDHFRIRTYVSESPTIQKFPGSPGRAGWFTGYQIVKRYMQKSQSSLPELFANTDNQSILRESGYRP